MAKQNKALFLLLSISYLFSGELTAAMPTATTANKKALKFIELSCKSATYSDVCVHSLSAYANTIQTSPQHLVKTALAVTLKHAQSTKLFVSHLRNSQFRTLQDCAPSTDKYISDLNKSIRELKLSSSASGQSQFLLHMRKAQALITSAEDDHNVENTCSGRLSVKMKTVKARVVNLRKEQAMSYRYLMHLLRTS